MTTAWVVGGSGLLGSAVRRAIGRRAGWDELRAQPLPWSAPDEEFESAVRERAARLLASAGAGGWAIVWTAGRSVPASSEADAERELERSRIAFSTIAGELRGQPDGALFLASSAGGVYAGSSSPPFTEETEPAPLAPYGRLKLALEDLAAATAADLGAPAVIGRIANLYGPGQDLSKPQGLISHLSLARFTSRTAHLYVPLDTLRDYVHVDDAAETVLDALELARERGGVTTKIVASGLPTTISTLLATMRRVTHGRPRAVLGASPLSARQPLDLRLRSVVWPELDRRGRRGLAEGVASVAGDVLAHVQAGGSSRAHA
ncbi:MAG: NAD-dependent epimerase/dehydratase family protein [Microbacteriaceae bacterium]|nr:NAD-dependent epimerase/dehydratase family protein [Microbacteriaceae bacterium]